MTRTVRLSVAARRDLVRLAAFLQPKSPAAAGRALAEMGGAIQSLADFPERGRAGPESMRELVVPFGRDGYVLRYRLGPELILVTRIFHTRERR